MGYVERRLENTRAVRVEYETDEGFGRQAYHDKVFVVEFRPNKAPLVDWVEDENFYIGKKK